MQYRLNDKIRDLKPYDPIKEITEFVWMQMSPFSNSKRGRFKNSGNGSVYTI